MANRVENAARHDEKSRSPSTTAPTRRNVNCEYDLNITRAVSRLTTHIHISNTRRVHGTRNRAQRALELLRTQTDG